MQRSPLPLLMVLVILGLFLMRESRQPPADIVDQVFTDWLATNASTDQGEAPLILVALDDAAAGKEEGAALSYALFLQAVLPLNPVVIGIVPPLDLLSRKNEQPQHMRILHDLVLKAPRLVLGAQLGFPEDPDVVPPVQEVPVLREVEGDRAQVPEFTVVEKQPRDELRLSPEIGFINSDASRAGAGKIPLVFEYRGQLVPSFALQVMALWCKLTIDDVKVRLGQDIRLGELVTIPIDQAGRLQLNPRIRTARYNYDDLLLAVEQRAAGQASQIPLEKFQGKMLLLINNKEGAESQAGAMNLAQGIATIQQGRYLTPVPFWVDFIIIATMSIFAWFTFRMERLSTLFATVVILCIYLLTCLTLYGRSELLMPLLLPLGLSSAILFHRLLSGPLPDAVGHDQQQL